MALKKVVSAIRAGFYDAAVRISERLDRNAAARRSPFVFLLAFIAGEEWENHKWFSYALLGLGLLVALGAFMPERKGK